MAVRHDHRIMGRLVKGAYWDTEIKRAQVESVDGFPVFTRKAATNVSYISNARKLLGMTDRTHPQFATHDAHTAAAAQHMGLDKETYEFQRLRSMGKMLHNAVLKNHKSRCRIYASLGAHNDLLAYLMRRLLENGAHSSCVNQIVAPKKSPPIRSAGMRRASPSFPAAPKSCGPEISRPLRANSIGFDLIQFSRSPRSRTPSAPVANATWTAKPLVAGGTAQKVQNPAGLDASPGTVHPAAPADVAKALDAAMPWDAPLVDRRKTLLRGPTSTKNIMARSVRC